MPASSHIDGAEDQPAAISANENLGAEISETNGAMSPDEHGNSESPTPRRKPDLARIPDVRRQAAKIFWEARAGSIKPADATRLVYILTAIAKMIEGDDLLARIEALEAAARPTARRN